MCADQIGRVTNRNFRRDDFDRFGSTRRIERRGEDEIACIHVRILKHHDRWFLPGHTEHGETLQGLERPYPVGPEPFPLDQIIPAFDGFAVVFVPATDAFGLHGLLDGLAGYGIYIKAVGGGFF